MDLKPKRIKREHFSAIGVAPLISLAESWRPARSHRMLGKLARRFMRDHALQAVAIVRSNESIYNHGNRS